MVCELCGTQSFLQARNETQDAEDMGMDFTTVIKTLKRRVVRRKKRDADGNIIVLQRGRRPKKKKERVEPKLPPLLDCVVATQMVLDAMARTLVDHVGSHVFPEEEYPKVVKELWFKFLHTWQEKATKPLLRCYNEFFLFVRREDDEKVDPAVTFDLLQQWDAQWEKKRAEEEGLEDDGDQEQQQKKEADTEESDDARAKKKKRKKDKEKKKKKTSKKKKKHGEEEKDEQGKDKEGLDDEEDKPRSTNRTGEADRRKNVLSTFSIVDLLGILMLASRVLNLGLLPSDFADWVKNGVIPYHNALSTYCADAPDVRDSVKFVVMFFQALMMRHKAGAPQIAYSAHNLQYHMGLRLPPLNVSLAAHRLCATFGFPGQVFRNFQWITGFMNADGEQPEPPLLLQAEASGYFSFDKPTEQDRARADEILHSEVGIIAHLVVAVKMCANWHEWIYERQHKEIDEEEKGDDGDEGVKHKVPPVDYVHKTELLPRRDLKAFTQFARQVFVNIDRSGIPEELEEHVNNLREIEKLDEQRASCQGRVKQNNLYAYPAIHVDGVLAESDKDIGKRLEFLRSREIKSESADERSDIDSFFYPVFSVGTSRSALHPAYEQLLELLCRKIDAPIPFVLQRLNELDRRLERLIYHFERTGYHKNLLQEGHRKWLDAKAPLKSAHTIIDISSATLNSIKEAPKGGSESGSASESEGDDE
ncbi:unnamed protein product [Phytophthora fragariaefolia]|uniref:Unnamed protein product n=1 Tax=Phytophthora fragariaefolia TaxID=1490495 RepID=A0A9W6Y779_9STRA|nr:unnamed protein product [Phytophthora fragariaefolia]